MNHDIFVKCTHHRYDRRRGVGGLPKLSLWLHVNLGTEYVTKWCEEIIEVRMGEIVR